MADARGWIADVRRFRVLFPGTATTDAMGGWAFLSSAQVSLERDLGIGALSVLQAAARAVACRVTIN